MEHREVIFKTLSELRHRLQTSTIPSSWSHSKLIAIWKGASKEKGDDPKAYRGLQVGRTFCKILVIIILRCLNQWYDSQLLKQQNGFRSGRGTTDGFIFSSKFNKFELMESIYTYTSTALKEYPSGIFETLLGVHHNLKLMFLGYFVFSPKTSVMFNFLEIRVRR